MDNLDVLDSIIKRKDDPNKKATFLGKVGVLGIVISCGLIARTLNELKKETQDKQE